jgi:hypothetical protein
MKTTKSGISVTESFMKQYCDREYDANLNYIHCPAQIDHSKTTCYIILDINALNHPDAVLDEIPLCCFLASRRLALHHACEDYVKSLLVCRTQHLLAATPL